MSIQPRTPDEYAAGMTADEASARANESIKAVDQSTTNDSPSQGADATVPAVEPAAKPALTTDEADKEMIRVYNELTGSSDEGERRLEAMTGADNQVQGETREPAPSAGDTNAQPSSAGDKSASDGLTAEPERLAKARTALKRWQWPDDVIDQLPANVIIERGEAAAKSQSSFDHQMGERTRMRSVIDEYERERSERQASEAGNSQEGTATESSSATTNPSESASGSMSDSILKEAGDLVEDEEMGPVIKSFAAGFKAMEEKMETLSQENQSLRQTSQGQQDARLIDGARRELTSEFPALKDQGTYDQVRELVYKLSTLPGYTGTNGEPDVIRMMRDAASSLIPPDGVPANTQPSAAQRQASQLDGQPDGHVGGQNRIGGMTNDQKMRLAFDKLANREADPETIRALLRRA